MSTNNSLAKAQKTFSKKEIKAKNRAKFRQNLVCWLLSAVAFFAERAAKYQVMATRYGKARRIAYQAMKDVDPLWEGNGSAVDEARAEARANVMALKKAD